jgi:hypothetical protein
MGLSIGEGQDGAPVRWGQWNGQGLEVTYIKDDVALMDASPSGRLLMTVAHDQSTLAIRATYDTTGATSVELDCATVVAWHPKAEPDNEAEPFWDWAGGFLNDTTVIASTDESDEEWGAPRHWLIYTAGTRPIAQVEYPFAVSSQPVALGDGAWYTRAEVGDALHVWTADHETQ